MALTEKSCVPCRGGIPPLDEGAAKEFLAQVPDWSLTHGAMAFVTGVGGLAEGEGHHPDITFGWGYADIVLFTHKIKGLHENDFIMAAKIDRLSRA